MSNHRFQIGDIIYSPESPQELKVVSGYSTGEYYTYRIKIVGSEPEREFYIDKKFNHLHDLLVRGCKKTELPDILKETELENIIKYTNSLRESLVVEIRTSLIQFEEYKDIIKTTKKRQLVFESVIS